MSVYTVAIFPPCSFRLLLLLLLPFHDRGNVAIKLTPLGIFMCSPLDSLSIIVHPRPFQQLQLGAFLSSFSLSRGVACFVDVMCHFLVHFFSKNPADAIHRHTSIQRDPEIGPRPHTHGTRTHAPSEHIPFTLSYTHTGGLKKSSTKEARRSPRRMTGL